MESLLNLLLAIQTVLSWIAWPYYYVKSRFKASVHCPPVKSPVLTLSATELARKIRTKELRSSYVIEEYIKRIQEVNPILNAVVEDRFPLAKQEALKVDEYIDSTEESIDVIADKFPLLGVPLTVKESCGLEGMSFAVGCLLKKGTRCPTDGKAVSLLKQAGAIPLCVTNTPEYCLAWETSNLLTGDTLNPYDVRRCPGGSSGGEGVLLGSGASVIAIGSDLSGSLRLPPFMNCVFGHKPTPWLISTENHFPDVRDPKDLEYFTVGPMARYAEDLPLLMKIMSGNKSRELKLDESVDLSTLNVFYKEDAGFTLAGPSPTKEIRQAINKSALYLRDTHGSHIIKGGFDDLKYALEMSGSVIMDIKDLPDLLETVRKDEAGVTPFKEIIKGAFGMSKFSLRSLITRHLIENKMFLSGSEVKRYKAMNEELKRQFEEKLGNNGVLLFPVFPVQCPFYGLIVTLFLGGVKYLQIVNSLGLPSTSVPLGLDQNGLPIGIQVIGAPMQDRLCLAVAKALEKGFGGWTPPPSS